MIDKNTSPAVVSTPARLRWRWTALVVVAIHVLVLLGFDRVLVALVTGDSEPPLSPVSVQMISVMPATPPAKPKPLPPPPSPTTGLIDPQALAPTPVPTPPPSQTLEATAPVPEPASVAEIDYSSRQPKIEDLPRTGGVALNVFWGDFTSGSKIAQGSIQLSFPAPDRYEVKLVTKAVGWASIFASNPLYAETVGSLGPGGLRPERYTHKTPGGKEEVAKFDYENKKISYSSLKEPLPMPNGIQDRLSFMVQLAWMMKINPERFSVGESVLIPMAGRSKIEDVSFMVLSDDGLVLPGGVLVPTVHLSSTRTGDRFKGQIDVWLDRTDRLLPVRIRFEEARGQVLDLLSIRTQ